MVMAKSILKSPYFWLFVAGRTALAVKNKDVIEAAWHVFQAEKNASNFAAVAVAVYPVL
jgi:hypothetical protein